MHNVTALALHLWAILQSNTIRLDSGIVVGVCSSSIIAIFISLIVSIQGNAAIFIVKARVQNNIWNQLHNFMLI